MPNIQRRTAKTRKPSDELNSRLVRKTRSSSILTDKIRKELLSIKVELVHPYSGQSRIHFDNDELKALAETIKRHGVRQPLAIIPMLERDGHFEVVSGERRLRAAKMAGLTRVPAILIENLKDAEEIALIENVQRTDLHPIEIGKSYERLLKQRVFKSASEMAIKIGVKNSQITEYVKFSRLPELVCKRLLKNSIFQRKLLRDLTLINSEKEMKNVIDNYLNEDSEVKKKTVNGDVTRTKKIHIMRVSFDQNGLDVDSKGLKRCNREGLIDLQKSLHKVNSEIKTLLSKMD